MYTATVYVNTAPHSFDGYQHHHTLAEVTRCDGSPLRLVFHAGERIRSHEDAADAAFIVGNRQGSDDHGQEWPSTVRSVSVGDVIKVTGPDHWIIHLSVDPAGFSAVPEPTRLEDEMANRPDAFTDEDEAAVESLKRLAQDLPCAECSHPGHAHRDGEDPVTPGVCLQCEADDPDNAYHDYSRS
ncbi:hypothetical protein [Streptomyces sp. NBC_00557]|uniref:hypothetical protein n=1 Tax=Streptomyces sp. NBC_00557 TaxID=2975776 RepID=UPI002E81EB36|nr:hypothetical protein [Streptomyces sp. NBC_00557]WUC39672.1 hypothetical protein OG956_38595 [Streptomyces sp. NBC_00557]